MIIMKLPNITKALVIINYLFGFTQRNYIVQSILKGFKRQLWSVILVYLLDWGHHFWDTITVILMIWLVCMFIKCVVFIT